MNLSNLKPGATVTHRNGGKSVVDEVKRSEGAAEYCYWLSPFPRNTDR